jgi:hypothetical protein
MSATYSNPLMQASFNFTIIPTAQPTVPATILVTDILPSIQPVYGPTTFSGGYSAAGSVASGTPVVINLLSVNDPQGNALSVDKVIGIKVQVTSGTGTLTVGGGTDPVIAAQAPIGLNDFYAASFTASPLPVVASTSQNLQLVSSSGTIGYVVTVLVRSS